MNKKRKLLKNTVIIFLGKLCTQFLSFFLLPIYTFNLNTHEYGMIDLILSYTGLIVPLISLQLEMAVFRFLVDSRSDKENESKIIFSGLSTIIILFLICSSVFLLISIFVNVEYKFIICALIFATMISSYLLQVARGLGDTFSFAIGSVITGVFNFIFSIIFILYFKWGVYGIFYATILSNLFCIIFLVLKLNLATKMACKKYDKEIIFDMLKYSLPLVPNGVIWWIINISDRTIISLLLNVSSSGIYAVSNKFSNVLIQVYNVFNLSWTESASLHINDEDSSSYFSFVFNQVIQLFTCLSLLIISFMPIIFVIMIDNSYISAYKYIPILMFGSIFHITVSFIGSIYIALKITSKVAKTSAIAGILNLVINLLLIKKLGIYAAAISTLISFLSMSIYRYYDVQKYIKLKIDLKMVIFLFLFGSIIVTLYYIDNFYLNVLSMIITLYITIFINKKILLAILNKLKKRKVLYKGV